MSYRLERVAHVIREVVSDAIANRISDPRVSRFTSVTRVEMSPDLRHAQVYVSVMGEEVEGATTMKGLESARGMIQSHLAKQLDMRQCPLLRFHLDRGLKVAAEISRQIDEALGRTSSGAVSPSAADGSDEAASDSPPAPGAVS
jgi:ribosome-binding factor A